MENTDVLLQKLLTEQNNYSVLIPNIYGYKLAKDNNAKEICLVLCASETMNKENINKDISETTSEFKNIIKISKKDEIRSKVYISVAFECPYEGLIDPSFIIDKAKEFISCGIDEVVIADTIGAAQPNQVKALFKELISEFSLSQISAHFHDTRLLALDNVIAAMDEGIHKFDSCIAGLGGCPFAPGASGNLATEDLVSMLHKKGIDTCINEEMLLDSVKLAVQLTS
jgi:hydroxymethylglutaryl-CoA lyase